MEESLKTEQEWTVEGPQHKDHELCSLSTSPTGTHWFFAKDRIDLLKQIAAAHNAALNAERQRLERLIEATHEVYKEQLARLKADYTRELNAKLEQINKQAETIREHQVEYDRLSKIIEKDTLRIVELEQPAAICCPICAHITSYPAGDEVVKCEHCLRSFQLEPNQERKPECR